MTSEPILSVRNLKTEFEVESGVVQVLDGVSFDVPKGKTLGIVGESGCGKSVTASSIMGLLPRPYGRVNGGEILYDGQDLAKIPKEEFYKVRGNRISMIFQEPMTALNPVQPVGKQIAEVFKLHKPNIAKEDYRTLSIEMLAKVGIPEPERRYDEFPHQLSGGMRQRVMIAIALACEPDVLIADEPTTALDVTIQAQILELMQKLQDENGMSIIFITHDLGVVAEMCDEVVVMYAGRVAEQASVFDIFEKPQHPYTQGLLASIPRLDGTPKTVLPTIAGQVPSLMDMPPGCRYASRCPNVTEQCKATPELQFYGKEHQVACWLVESNPVQVAAVGEAQ
ncbi:ABC transporter ATP-binding protein [Reinekea marina]|uniref:ABC-type dipeptide transporter n=1 Tax=Reinekea marina TaxID=1310421 RepID=A0ABV7WVB1_9GAMM|nr:ABC transporter ATP-binding protein [Reinekea marina]MDN3648982.1 ABC transporter ATP-binding protein [Reinekea marina]